MVRVRTFSGGSYLTNSPTEFTTVYRVLCVTNEAFIRFCPGSLNHLIWTNFIAHTNGRTTLMWTPRSTLDGAPVARWASNSLLWGMRGMTALSPCWTGEGNRGQIPITALTKRHGYTRGHSMGPDGFGRRFVGSRVWFVTADNRMVEVNIVREVIRSVPGGARRDYTVVLFDRDLPGSIEPLRVVSSKALAEHYPQAYRVPRPVLRTEQTGHVSAEVPGWAVEVWKGGDSGSPDLLPLPGELIFLGGRSTSAPSPEMQADMDELCRLQGLDAANYQMKWADFSAWPIY